MNHNSELKEPLGFNENMKSKYQDIIHLPHKQSSTRPHMPVADRAAQFAPFAALVGYDDAVKETARLTDSRRELSDGALEQLNAKLNYIQEHLDDQPEVTITYFQADSRKSGGAYLTCTGIVKRVDDYEHTVLMQDGREIFIDDITEIGGSAFQLDKIYNGKTKGR